MNSGCSLNATLECVLWLGFLQKINCTVFRKPQLPLCFFNHFEFWQVHSWILCLQKVFGFPQFCFYYLFMKLFLFQSKTKNTVKDINQIFASNKLNEKKIRTPFCKKGNLWAFDTLTDFFWNFCGRLELVKVKSIQPEVPVFRGQFYEEAEIIFWCNLLIRQW